MHINILVVVDLWFIFFDWVDHLWYWNMFLWIGISLPYGPWFKSLVRLEEQRAGQEGVSRSIEDKIPVSLFLKEHEDDNVEPNETVAFALISYSYCRCLASIGEKNGRRQAFVRPPTVVTLPHPRGPLEAPFSIDWCVWFAQSFGCSLSLGKGRYLSTFGGVAGILTKF